MTRYIKTLTIILFFVIKSSEAFSQCTNFEIIADKTGVCSPAVIKYYVTNAPIGSLFEWDIAVERKSLKLMI